MTTKAEMLKYVRLFCSECMGGPRSGLQSWPVDNPSDIEGCTARDCIWYEYRFGKDPHKNPAKQRAARERFKASGPIAGRKKTMRIDGKDGS